jgi:hypothetical protein
MCPSIKRSSVAFKVFCYITKTVSLMVKSESYLFAHHKQFIRLNSVAKSMKKNRLRYYLDLIIGREKINTASDKEKRTMLVSFLIGFAILVTNYVLTLAYNIQGNNANIGYVLSIFFLFLLPFYTLFGVTFKCPYCYKIIGSHLIPARCGTMYQCPHCCKTIVSRG